MVDGARPDAQLRRIERRAKVLGWCVAAYALAFVFLRHPVSAVTRYKPFDLDINLVAARRLLGGRNVYDAAASRTEGIRYVSGALHDAYRDTFSSFVGAPVVAALHAPFTFLAHSDAVASARLLNLACVLAAVGFIVAALPRCSRTVAALVGVSALALSQPLIASTELGQVHGIVMLGLAVGIWGVATRRYAAAGIGLGVAAMLKVSPALLIVYLGFRLGRRIVIPAVATVFSLSVVAAAVGSPSSVIMWIRDVLPSLSVGTRYVRNQSVPAFLARLTGSNDIIHQMPLGTFRIVGPCLALGLGCAIFSVCRRRGEIRPVELGALVLVVLLAGPLSWDHYYAWAVLPVATFCDIELWKVLSGHKRIALLACCGVGIFLLSLPFDLSLPREVAAAWYLRMTGSPTVLGGAALLAVALALLKAQPKVEESELVSSAEHVSLPAESVHA